MRASIDARRWSAVCAHLAKRVKPPGLTVNQRSPSPDAVKRRNARRRKGLGRMR